MYYAPHTLQRLVPPTTQRDEYNRVVAQSEGTWEDVCSCRMDDNATQDIVSDNGQVYRPKYKVVCEGVQDIAAGERVRAYTADGTLRGEGEVVQVLRTNYLDYTVLFI